MILIDLHGRKPVYEQIKEEIIRLVNAGYYKPDDKLPSIRVLSRELGVNINTVKRAFNELEADSVVISVPGKGVFVSGSAVNNQKIRLESLSETEAALRSARSRGVTRQELEELIRKIFEVENND